MSSTREAFVSQMTEEARAMASYALGAGRAVPGWALDVIAREEAGHAELAWRAVRWAIEERAMRAYLGALDDETVSGPFFGMTLWHAIAHDVEGAGRLSCLVARVEGCCV